MSGIEILQSIETNIYAWGWTEAHILVAVIFIGCAGLLLLFMRTYKGYTSEDIIISVTSIAMVIALLSIFPLGVGKGKEVKNYTTYQVLIDETANPVELLDKYDIIKQEGKTYWIREKGWNNY